MPIVDALSARYKAVEKIDPAIAREAAVQAIAFGLGATTFGPLLRMNVSSKYWAYNGYATV